MESIKFNNFTILYERPKKNIVSFYLFWEIFIPLLFYVFSMFAFLILKDLFSLPKAVIFWIVYFFLGHIIMSIVFENHTDRCFKRYNLYKKLFFMVDSDRIKLEKDGKNLYINFGDKSILLENFLEEKIDVNIQFNNFKKYIIEVRDDVTIKEY